MEYKVQSDMFRAPEATKRGPWPSEQLATYLSGQGGANPAIKSWASLEIWKAAEQICAMPTLEKRRTALEKIPVVIRLDVKDQMRRIWAAR